MSGDVKIQFLNSLNLENRMIYDAGSNSEFRAMMAELEQIMLNICCGFCKKKYIDKIKHSLQTSGELKYLKNESNILIPIQEKIEILVAAQEPEPRMNIMIITRHACGRRYAKKYTDGDKREFMRVCDDIVNAWERTN